MTFHGPLFTAFQFCQPLTIIPLVFLPQVSLASFDVEVLLTLGLNLSCLGWAEHILELQPVPESLRGRVHYVTVPSNERFLPHASPLWSQVPTAGHQRREPATYQLEVVSMAGPWCIWPEGQPGPRVQALRLKVWLQLL